MTTRLAGGSAALRPRSAFRLDACSRDNGAQHREIAPVREQRPRLGGRHPTRLVDLVAKCLLAADHSQPPVPHLLLAATGISIPRRRGSLVPELAHEAGLLLDLPERTVLVTLAALALALRERPVAVGGPVDDEHLEAAVTRARAGTPPAARTRVT